MKNSYIIILIIVVFVLGSIFGFYTGLLNLTSSSTPKGQENTFVSGWGKARQTLLESRHFDRKVTRLNGTVKEVENNKITFEAPLNTPLDNESLKTRTVVIDDNTEPTFRSQKPREQYNKDRKKYSQEIDELEENIDSVREEMNTCQERSMEAEIENEAESNNIDCSEINKKYRELQDKRRQLRDKMDRYIVEKDPDISKIEAGDRISVVSQEKQEQEEQEEDTMGMIDEDFENIAEKEKFTASKIDITENEDIGEAI